MKLEGGRGRAVTRAASEAGWSDGARRDPPRASHRAPRARPKADATDAVDAACRLSEAKHLSLTARENEVFHMLVDGLAVNEIAHALHLSARTVDAHVTHILHKLALDDSADLIGYAVRHGLIDEGGEGVV